MADRFKEVVERDNHPLYPRREDFLDRYQALSEELHTYHESELNSMITDKTRLERYDSLDWFYGKIALKDVGPWPEMDGLDIRLTTENIPKLSEKYRLNGKKGLI